MTFGTDAVVGAGAWFTSDVPAFSSVTGKPAAVVRVFESLAAMTAYMTARQPLQGPE